MGKVEKLPERSKPSEGYGDPPKIKNPTPNSIQRKPVPKSAIDQQRLSSPPVNHGEHDLSPPPCYERHEAERNESEIHESEIREALLEQTHAASIESASVGNDGRINIDLDSRFGKTLSRLLPNSRAELDQHISPPPPPPEYSPNAQWTVSLSIVIQVVGSRGDVQPFIALGNELQRCGHRVRLATHNIFEKFVTGNGLDFYPIGGDPEELMAYMVKNPGLIPSMKTLRGGDISKKRAMIAEMLDGFWQSCTKPDLLNKRPFVADAIIANPPSFAHIHCAQALGIPLHIMFTMPWTSTSEFPHPLANLKASSVDTKMANYLSYGVVQWMTWQGIGDIINAWRKTLDLAPVPNTEGALLAESLRIPHTYCWSPALVPKPVDWPAHIDVCGFFFKDDTEYTPPPDLQAFLEAGPPPIYIGFGSIVIDDAENFTNLILQTVQTIGVRAIISKGWSKLGANLSSNIPDVYFVDDCPHEWLFTKVTAVVHHGGAGTTACGMKFGRPTVIIPFFGDQPFWGERIASVGVGPKPIAYKALTSHNLAEAIRFCLSPSASEAAQEIAQKLAVERGVKTAVNSFHKNLPLERMRCDILPNLPAAWKCSKGKVELKLSNVAAETLIEYRRIERKNLKVHHTNPIAIEHSRWDPVTGGAAAMIETSSEVLSTGAGILTKPIEVYINSRNTIDSGGATAANMGMASMKSFYKFSSALFKGTMIDMPLAVTDGLRQVPSLYGEKVTERMPVTGWKSGAKVAGSEFVHGMSDGFSDLFIQPVKDAKKDGALGFAKGLGKGTIGMPVKMASGMIGLVAYPAEGFARSIHTVTHTKTKKSVAATRIAVGEEGEKVLGKEMKEGAIRRFDDLVKQQGQSSGVHDSYKEP